MRGDGLPRPLRRSERAASRRNAPVGRSIRHVTLGDGARESGRVLLLVDGLRVQLVVPAGVAGVAGRAIARIGREREVDHGARSEKLVAGVAGSLEAEALPDGS